MYTSLKNLKKESTTRYTYHSNIFAEKKFGTLDLKSLKDVADLVSSVNPFHIVADAHLKACNP